MATNILMPALSPTMEEGTLTRWLKKEGDAVKAGDVIAEIETDKATMEVEAVDEGTLSQILVADGTENVKVNTPIAVLTEEGESAPPPSPAAAGATSPASGGGKKPPEAKSEQNEQGSQKVEEARQPVSSPAGGGGGGSSKARTDGGGMSPSSDHADRILASPLAKRIAADGKVDLKLIVGTGPGGRIVKADVEKALAEGPPKPKKAEAPVPPPRGEGGAAKAATGGAVQGALPDARLFYKDGTYRTVPHDGMRKTVAKRLTVAKRDIPHYYLTADIEIDALLAAREAINARSPKDGEGAYKVSVNDFVVKAAAAALIKVPDVNASWTETEMLLHQHADIGIAVALPGGLITPIIFAAETKGLVQISREAKDLAARAKAKKLKPSDYEGGSFSVSNLGMFGMRDFTAVINPPQASILAVGAGEKRPVVRGDRLEIATVMTVRMSCDHRVIDGALGATWLKALKEFLEDPATMLA